MLFPEVSQLWGHESPPYCFAYNLWWSKKTSNSLSRKIWEISTRLCNFEVYLFLSNFSSLLIPVNREGRVVHFQLLFYSLYENRRKTAANGSKMTEVSIWLRIFPESFSLNSSRHEFQTQSLFNPSGVILKGVFMAFIRHHSTALPNPQSCGTNPWGLNMNSWIPFVFYPD